MGGGRHPDGVETYPATVDDLAALATTKFSSLATRSVSELISTIAARPRDQYRPCHARALCPQAGI